MKKNILALAVASAMVAPITMADEGKKGPQVYGKFNVALESITDEGQTINNRASRLGVKGSEDLGNGMKAVYKLEGEVLKGSTGGDDGTFDFKRDTWFGLAGNFGEVRMGQHDSPLKMVQVKDQFNDASLGDNAKFLGSIGAGKSGEDRYGDSLVYLSPDFGGIKLMAQLVTEKYDDTAPTNASKEDNSLTNITSFAATYGSSKKGLYVAAAMTTHDAVTGNDGSEMRFGVQYADAGLMAGVQYDSADFGVEASAISVNLGYKMGNLMPKAKFATIDYDAGDASTSMGIGVDYKLAKQVTTYVEYVSLDENNVNTGADSVSAVSLGVSYKF